MSEIMEQGSSRLINGNDKGSAETSQARDNEQVKEVFKEQSQAPTAARAPAASYDADLIAWMQVASSFLINLNNFGFANSFGAFQAFYETDMLKTYSTSSIAWIGTLQTSLIMIIGAVSGPLFDLGFYYPILLGSSILIVFALMMLSLSTQYYQVMLTWGVLLGVCSGLVYIPSVSMMPLYFKTRHRGLAIGLATSGGSIGGVVYPIVVRRVLDTAGFGWACRSLGFLSLASLAGAILLIRPLSAAEKKPVRQLFDFSATKDVSYLLTFATSFVLWLGFLVPFILTPSYGLTGLNPPLRADLAYYLLAVPNAAQFFGRIVPGMLADAKIMGAETMLLIAIAICGVLILCWIAVTNLGGFVVVLIFYGFFCGSITTMPALVIPYLCPSMAVYGTRMGMAYAAAGVGTLIGAPVALAISDASNDTGRRAYFGAQIWGGITMLAGSALFIYAAIEVRKKRMAAEHKMAAAAAAAPSTSATKA